jgi:cellobiose-specific phosphotransferase system component IIA
MKKKQRVADMADEVLARQARVRAGRTGESIEEALKAVRNTEAGQQLEELSEGPHRDERAQEWQEGLVDERAEERQRRRGQSG